MLGSIINRCSINDPALLPEKKNKDQNQKSNEIEPSGEGNPHSCDKFTLRCLK